MSAVRVGQGPHVCRFPGSDRRGRGQLAGTPSQEWKLRRVSFGTGWLHGRLRVGRLRCGSDQVKALPCIRASVAGKEAPPATAAEREGEREVLDKWTLPVTRTRKVEGEVTVRLEQLDEKVKDGGKRCRQRLIVGCNLPGKWVLHWGVTYSGDTTSEWDQPPVEMRPPGSVPIKGYAVETPLIESPAGNGKVLNEVHIGLENCSSSVEAIHFVLKEEETGTWYQDRGMDFMVPLLDSKQVDGTDPEVPCQNGRGSTVDTKTSMKLKGIVNGYAKEYSIFKEETFQNSVTISYLKSHDMDKIKLLLDTDIPGKVVMHWGVCRDCHRNWDISRISVPPESKVFRKKAVQTSMQTKMTDVGSWVTFSLDKDVLGLLFVLKVDDRTWVNDMGSDFYFPIQTENDLFFHDTNGVRLQLQDLTNGSTEDVSFSANNETLPDTQEPIKDEELVSKGDTDGIVNEIRNLVSDISSERSMISTSKEVQENILQEIERLAAEAYSIFRTATPVNIEELVADVESSTPKVFSASGTGYDILCQCFNWESNKSGKWYSDLATKADELSELGITAIWLPPPTESVSPQGYMPGDLFNLNSRYGSVEELKHLINKMHGVGIKVLGDVVLNHRCAQYQNSNGIWNIFGGQLNWDDRAVVSDDPHFQGRGNRSTGEHFHAAPNIDHSQEFVRNDLKEWLRWLRREIGFDGWRLDFVRGFWGGYIKDYMEASEPYFAVGEFWDGMSYTYGVMDHNQDAHRQRMVDWINATNGTSCVFDITTKGIFHAALENCEYWRLCDAKGKPPGVIGWWPSRAVTFIENHDTGSTQGHWRFPCGKEMQGYAYILTHPGTPTVFCDHIFSNLHQEIAQLVSVRRKNNIHCRSEVKIKKAESDVYAAEIDNKLVMKIGPGHYEPGNDHRRWRIAAEGRDYKVWESV